MQQQLTGEGYEIEYVAAAEQVVFKGALRLGGLPEYAPIVELLNTALLAHTTLTLDLSQLEFLNSSGIATLSKFVITVRNRGDRTLRVIGAANIPWQGKSLKNLQRLMPTLELTFC